MERAKPVCLRITRSKLVDLTMVEDKLVGLGITGAVSLERVNPVFLKMVVGKFVFLRMA